MSLHPSVSGTDFRQVNLSPKKVIGLRIEAGLEVKDEILLSTVLSMSPLHGAQSQLKRPGAAHRRKVLVAPDS